jgi:hypothetical protein
MNLAELENSVYLYFPKLLSPFSEEFDSAPETLRKQVMIRRKKEIYAQQWNDMLENLRISFLKGIYDGTGLDNITNPFLYAVASHGIGGRLLRWHIMLSLIERVHCIFISLFRHNAAPLSGDIDSTEIIKYMSLSDDLNMRRHFAIINDCFVAKFNSEFKAYSALAGYNLPMIHLQDRPLGTATLFDCLFTTNLVLY